MFSTPQDFNHITIRIYLRFSMLKIYILLLLLQKYVIWSNKVHSTTKATFLESLPLKLPPCLLLYIELTTSFPNINSSILT